LDVVRRADDGAGCCDQPERPALPREKHGRGPRRGCGLIMPRLLYLLPVALLAALSIFFYLQLGSDPQKLPSALVDKPMPVFDLKPIEGRTDGFASETLKGQVSLVNIWASWCPPCRAEHPILMQIAKSGMPIYG